MRALCLMALGLFLAACASLQLGEWPGEVVSFDRMEVREPLNVRLTSSRTFGLPAGRVVCLLWVDEQGRVQQVRLVEESGSRELDGAVVRGARDMRFQPWASDGQPRAVSVVMPVNFSKRVELPLKGVPDIVPGIRGSSPAAP
ncbi:energy transducer TonB [Uliginosibacterium sp. 31-16]|uniref:energy transducer TonB family protein n=1 Tax=Uliginosibacterium sp. 31-16 TaxID=3068315 RepID=UPI00273D017F|nr:energy transducer TonB [Uliginosibacterium sp. 31-16]MDP5238349.1 energy transducer TonB [Uliginosibacterium sp. 31-16]